MQPKHQLGLIGYPLTHSFSKKYFTEKFRKEGISDIQYELFPLENIEQFPRLLEQNPSLIGLNVTIPYKEKVMPFLDKIDETAQAAGAVNTIKMEDGMLTGYNTDVYGFEESLVPLLKSHHTSALILGTGGAAKAIKFVLKRQGIMYRSVSRTPNESQFSYEDLDQITIENYSIIINSTPLGTHPNIENFPNIPYHYLSKKHLLYDLVYNPAETLFLKKGKAHGATIKNGIEMLFLQAEKAWEIWKK